MITSPTPNAEGFYRLETGFSIEILLAAWKDLREWDSPNLQEPFWRLYKVTQPGASVLYESTEIPLQPDTIYLIPPNTPYRPLLHRPIDKVHIHFVLSDESITAKPGIHEVAVTPEMHRLFESMKGDNEPLFMVYGTALITEALSRLDKRLFVFQNQHPAIRALGRKIRQHPDTPLTNAAMADMVAMSEKSLQRLFAKELGHSPQVYQLSLRLEQAAILLTHTQLSIDAITQRTGFRERNYFSKMFKKYRGTSPAQYRKERR